MRTLVITAVAALALPAVAQAALPGKDRSVSAKAAERLQVADNYTGGKVCRRVGSATVCN